MCKSKQLFCGSKEGCFFWFKMIHGTNMISILYISFIYIYIHRHIHIHIILYVYMCCVIFALTGILGRGTIQIKTSDGSDVEIVEKSQEHSS